MDIARPSLCSPRGRRCLIVTPHPDDETIGAGATMPAMRDCLVVALTDGAPHDAGLWGRVVRFLGS
jgi:LmbE family N-acetylglucosaminyl deacetylase